MIVLLVTVFLGYQAFERWMSPCEGIFQQSAASLGTKLDVVKAKGELVIGRQKIQDLTERSQQMALNLKSCCIVLGHATSEFLRCKDGFDRYDADISRVASSLRETEAARQQGNTAVANQKIAEVDEGLKAVDASSRDFAAQLKAIERNVPSKETPETTSKARGQARRRLLRNRSKPGTEEPRPGRGGLPRRLEGNSAS